MADRPGFFEELKRRKVVRVGIVYGAVAWAVVQVADVFVPALGLPESLLTVVAVLVILGLPVVLVLAWILEVTPAGVRRTGKSEETPSSGSGWVGVRTVATAVVLLGIGYLAGTVLDESPGEASSLDRTAVAVLPFDTRGIADEEGFAEGMHDDILTQLSRIDALRVTSRTSVQEYRETTKNIREIAAELGVGTVLEGGVQRTSDRVRINMQLIDGGTDEHLWAETFDRELTAENIFAIQSEIARAVAGALETALTPEDESELAEVPTTSVEALDHYHRARRLFWGVDNRDRFRAVPVLEQALALDPGFARAWALLSMARSWQIREGASGDTLPAREALNRVQELAPGSVEAALAEGNYRYYARGDYAGALAGLRTAAAGQSGDTDLIFTVANVLRRLGQWEEATELYEEVVRLAPRDSRAAYDLAWQYRMLGRFGDSESEYLRFRSLQPEEDVWDFRAELALLGRGDTVEARRIVEDAAVDPRDAGLDRVYGVLLAHFRGDRPPAGLDLSRGDQDISFATYGLFTSGSSELLEARIRWVLGDTVGAREVYRGLAGEYLEENPVIQPGSNVIGPGEDIFGSRATHLLLLAWEALFAARPERARELADRAIELHSIEDDSADGAHFVRQRAMIRAQAGDPAGAVADLEWILSVPSLTTPWELRLDPIYDPLRDRADFLALVTGAP